MFVVLLRWSRLVAVQWLSVLCWGGVAGGGVADKVMVLLVRFWFLVAGDLVAPTVVSVEVKVVRCCGSIWV
jgi:hypothetical protein